MKKYLLIFLLMSFTSQPDVQKRAQVAVASHLKSLGEDQSMYSPVRWGSVEKAMSTYEMTAYYKLGVGMILKDQMIILEDYKKMAREAVTENERTEYQKKANDQREQASKLVKDLEEKKAKYKPTQYGWKLFHQYKYPTGSGEIKEFGRVFYMDMKFKIIDPDTIGIKVASK